MGAGKHGRERGRKREQVQSHHQDEEEVKEEKRKLGCYSLRESLAIITTHCHTHTHTHCGAQSAIVIRSRSAFHCTFSFCFLFTTRIKVSRRRMRKIKIKEKERKKERTCVSLTKLYWHKAVNQNGSKNKSGRLKAADDVSEYGRVPRSCLTIEEHYCCCHCCRHWLASSFQWRALHRILVNIAAFFHLLLLLPTHFNWHHIDSLLWKQ